MGVVGEELSVGYGLVDLEREGEGGALHEGDGERVFDFTGRLAGVCGRCDGGICTLQPGEFKGGYFVAGGLVISKLDVVQAVCFDVGDEAA